jgi:hypothetical protein
MFTPVFMFLVFVMWPLLWLPLTPKKMSLYPVSFSVVDLSLLSPPLLLLLLLLLLLINLW